MCWPRSRSPSRPGGSGAPSNRRPGRRTLTLNLGELRRAGLARALTPVALFELGNVATTLLILRASDLLQVGGRDATAATSLAILLYAAHNAAASLAAIGGGHLADRFTARHVFMAGAAVYIGGYLVFAVGPTAWPVLLLGFAPVRGGDRVRRDRRIHAGRQGTAGTAAQQRVRGAGPDPGVR